MTTLIKKILLLPATCLIPFLTGCNNCPSTTIVEDIILFSCSSEILFVTISFHKLLVVIKFEETIQVASNSAE